MIEALKTLKLWQVVVLVVVVLGTAWGVYGIYRWAAGPSGIASSLPANTQLVPVQYGNLVNSVSASGSLVFPTREQLTFGSAGTVQEVNVNEGDTVEEGQALAKLDGASLTSLEKAVAQARINLRNAEENLETAQNPYTESDIAQVELAVINARMALETAEDNLEKAENPYTADDIARAEAQVETAQVNLDNARQDLADTQKEWATKIQEAEDGLSDAIEAYKGVFRNYFGMKLTEEQLWQEPDTIFAQANIDPIVLFEMWRHYLMSEADEVLEALASEAGGTWNPINVFLWQYLFPERVSGEDIIEEAQEAWDALIEAKDELDVTPLRAAQAIAISEGEVAQAEDSLTQAEENLADIKAGPDPLDVEQKQKQVAVAEANLAEAEEALAEMQSSADSLEVELAQLEVASAQAALDEALERLEMNTMVAPLGGIVTSVNVEGGEAVNASTVAIELVDPSVVEVSAILDEIDVSQVKQGQRAVVSLDALPDLELSGEVSAISAVAWVQAGVVSYPVTIRVTPPSRVQLREGMSATASIVVQEVNNVLLIPNQAIGGSLKKPTVTVVVNGQPEVRAVTLGATDYQWTEVVKGLQAGEMVMVEGATAGTTQKGFPGGFPGFPGGGKMR